MAKRRKFDRRSKTRTYRRVFLIVTEGSETEPQYFLCFRDQVVPTVKIVDRKGDSAPERLLKAIKHAIERARRRDNPPCPDWPTTTGTTVYRLVEAMLNAN